MEIRTYTATDESAWLKCRVLSFMFCSYATDVLTTKQHYAQPAIELVAIQDGRLVGLIDVECQAKLMTYRDQVGAMVWNLAVLPEYQRMGIAAALWESARKQLLARRIHYCELWTQDDVPANHFYRRQGFRQCPEMTYLRCFLKPGERDVILGNYTQRYYVETYEIQVPFKQKATMIPLCQQITEVRMYAQTF